MESNLSKHQDRRIPVIDEPDDGSAGEDMPVPPFVADAVKMAALYHIERIRELTPSPQTAGEKARSNNLDEDIAVEDDRLDRQRIIRRMLMADINELFQNIVVLEGRLTKRRTDTLRWQIAML